ncbi:MAG: Ppx/GppA family phosphatase [Sandaracinus sp.]|nr:Ppx/GppA family phosphatase [Sandaracinus sp.]
MPRFAAIDVGSNASRLLIVQAKEPERVRPFRSVRVPVRLGHNVFQTGELDPEAIDQCVEAMRTFAAAMEDARVDDYRAVVTASARSAKNGHVLLERVRREAGITLDAVDGTEEARLVGLAVRESMPLEGHALLMDLGGGSLELSEIVPGRDGSGFVVSLAIGTVRLLEAFLRGGEPVTEDQDRLVREYLDRLLAPHRRKLRRRPWDHVVGTGGNLVAIAELVPAATQGVPAIDVERARELLRDLSALPAAERATKHDLRPDRADVIVPALYVVVAMADLADVERIEVPGVGVKEGIVTELVEKHYRVWDYGAEDDKILVAALHLGRRYHFDERHAIQVTDLATKIFDATQTLHGLGAKSRMMLKVASLLHDVGDFINPQAHHKHSQYIIENSDLMGVTPEMRAVIALVARYHRRGMPAVRHAAFRDLTPDYRERVRKLTAILRIADALELSVRAHLGKAQELSVEVLKNAGCSSRCAAHRTSRSRCGPWSARPTSGARSSRPRCA